MAQPFDRFCSLIEKCTSPYARVIEQTLRTAALFLVEQPTPADCIHVPPDEFGKAKKQIETFFLPFQRVVIASNEYAIAITNPTPNPRGFGVARKYDIFYESNLPDQPTVRVIMSGEITIHGWNANQAGNLDVSFSMTSIITETGNEINETSEHRLLTRMEQEIRDGVRAFVFSAIQITYLMSAPTHFVVEERPRKPRPENSPKIPRSPDRSKFTMLTPAQIKTKYVDRLEEDTAEVEHGHHKTPVPHARRRHLRCLGEDKFVVVSACWIGPSEFETLSGRKYIVRLDL